jgi:hypothetical protein
MSDVRIGYLIFDIILSKKQRQRRRKIYDVIISIYHLGSHRNHPIGCRRIEEQHIHRNGVMEKDYSRVGSNYCTS